MSEYLSYIIVPVAFYLAVIFGLMFAGIKLSERIKK